MKARETVTDRQPAASRLWILVSLQFKLTRRVNVDQAEGENLLHVIRAPSRATFSLDVRDNCRAAMVSNGARILPQCNILTGDLKVFPYKM